VRPVAAVKSMESDTSKARPANPVIPVAPAPTASNQRTADQLNVAEAARVRTYLYVSSLPGKVEFVVYVMRSQSGMPWDAFASQIAQNLGTRNKTASATVFSPAFASSGTFDSFFKGRGGSAIRAMALSSMANRLLLARVEVWIEMKKEGSVEELVRGWVDAEFAVLSTKDGSLADSFELHSEGAGINSDAATSAALGRLLKDLGDHGY
jgi:hypothetical protein